MRKGPATPGDFLDFATDAGMVPNAAEGARLGRAPPPPAVDETWLTAPFPPKPAPPPPDPRELPIIERPRPTRPIDPPPPPPSLAAWTPPPEPLASTPAPAASGPPRRPGSSRRRRPHPRPRPPGPAAPLAPVAAATAASDIALLDRIAAAAGIPLTAIAGRDPDELADEIGAVLRLTTANLIQMAASRRQTKSAIRSAQHTMYKPTENNPLKFAASPEHAMEIDVRAARAASISGAGRGGRDLRGAEGACAC